MRERLNLLQAEASRLVLSIKGAGIVISQLGNLNLLHLWSFGGGREGGAKREVFSGGAPTAAAAAPVACYMNLLIRMLQIGP